MNDVTRIIEELRAGGGDEARDRLVPVVYEDLRAIAKSAMRRERPDHSLQATDLVHEAWLRLMAGASPTWEGRRQFFHAAAEAMRRILVEHARARTRHKRGGHRVRVELSGIDLADEHALAEVVALDDAFRRLEKEDRQAADVMRLRLFAGLSVEETAKVMELSERTVKREWAFARAWLADALGLTQP
jgi:RNA polymerase sigma factor (TIGR02999 family)